MTVNHFENTSSICGAWCTVYISAEAEHYYGGKTVIILYPGKRNANSFGEVDHHYVVLIV